MNDYYYCWFISEVILKQFKSNNAKYAHVTASVLWSFLNKSFYIEMILLDHQHIWYFEDIIFDPETLS